MNPWKSSQIIIASSRWAYIRVASSIGIIIPIGLWFYGMFQSFPIQKEFLILTSFIAGLLVWFLLLMLEYTRRRCLIDIQGIRLRNLISERFITWDRIDTLETWKKPRDKSESFRISFINAGGPFTFDGQFWSNARDGISAIQARTHKLITRVSPPGLDEVYYYLFLVVPIGIVLFSVSESTVMRALGFLSMRVFWIIFISRYPKGHRRRYIFYLLISSMAAFLCLAILSDALFLETLVWLLYTPILEVVASAVFIYLLKKSKFIEDEEGSNIAL
jgi:hypothetical protein